MPLRAAFELLRARVTEFRYGGAMQVELEPRLSPFPHGVARDAIRGYGYWQSGATRIVSTAHLTFFPEATTATR